MRLKVLEVGHRADPRHAAVMKQQEELTHFGGRGACDDLGRTGGRRNPKKMHVGTGTLDVNQACDDPEKQDPEEYEVGEADEGGFAAARTQRGTWIQSS